MLSGYRLKEARANREAGERQELEAKLAPVKQELSATLQRSDKFLKLDFTLPLAQIAQFIQDGVAAVDLATPYPTTSEPQNGNCGKEQFYQFVYEILPRRGFTLSESGSMRLLYFMLALAKGRGVDMSSLESWSLAFDKMYALDLFDIASAEVGYSESQRVIEPVVEAPEPEPTVDDLERIDTSTREGKKIAHQILSRAIFDGEAKEVYLGWLRSLVNNFGYEMPEDVQRQVIDYFLAGRRSWLDKKAYDDCRLNFCKRGIMPPTCLTESDIANASIEDADTQTWQGRRNLKLELAASRLRTN